MRLALLIAGVGALSLIGAVLGRGLGAPDSGGAEAQAVGTPTALALAPMPAASVAGGAVAPPVSTAAPPESAQPQPASSAAPSPSVATAVGRPTLHVTPFPTSRASAGAAAPQRLPRTGGDDTESVTVLALVLFVIGVVLCVTPRAIVGGRDKKE